jgi:hypothetical protein
VVTLHTGGSSFDTLLGVYAGEELATLEVIAQDDNSGLDRASVAVFSVEEGRVYHFAVAGLLQESGVVSLRWRFQVPCHGPGALVAPSPAPDDTGVAANVVLEWSQLDTTTRPVIYGEDDRREIYEIDDPGLFAAWEATAALVWDHRLSENDDGTFALLADTFSAFYGLCPDEPYFDQPVPPAHCTGFLVADDLLVTAGHCLNGQRDCEDVVFVFGFRMLDADTPVLTFHGSQIFRCAEVIVRQVQMPNRIDWALVRLDRPVTDRIPLELRRSGEVADQQPIVVVGHPGGLPAKVAAGAEVRSNVAAGYFDANLDTYQGNSGSPVLNADTLVVEGMLIRGDKDFVPQEADGDCRVSKRCEDDQCVGESVLRTTVFEHDVPARPQSKSYEVYFGPIDAMVLLGETAETHWPLADLAPGVTYGWQVVAYDDCGFSAGPVWRFTTATDAPFRRGDVNGDFGLDISDAINILEELFVGVPSAPLPDCRRSRDVDDSGSLDTTDPVALLSHLYQGTPPPAFPFEECGEDSTADALGCVSYPSCE